MKPIREQVSDALRKLYNSTVEEPIPHDWLKLLDRLK